MDLLEKKWTKSTIDPATGRTLETYEVMRSEQARKVLEKMHAAFGDWSKRSVESRCQVIQQMGRVVRERSEEIANLMSQEMGKTLEEARQEIELCAGICDYTAEKAPGELADLEKDLEGGRAVVTHQPIGIVLGIQPWNFPLYQAMRFSVPNLAAGNAVILKHAENVWGSGDLIEEMFRQAGVPQDVFRHLKIDHDTAEALIADERIRAVTFTGSAKAGAHIATLAAKQRKKTVLELGSNDAYLVLEDADLEAAVQASVMGRVNNCGQTCVAAKRFIVVESVYDEFKKAYLEAMEGVTFGHPIHDEPDIGPMAREDLREKLHEQVEESIEKGARCLLGGEIPPGRGFYYPPTVLENVQPGMPAYDDELFGPVASLIKARDEKDAIRIANDSRFGLGGGIFSRDEARALRLAREEFDTGMVNINGYHLAQPHLPFGGVKDSGYGREHGGHGLKEFVNIKTVMIAQS